MRYRLEISPAGQRDTRRIPPRFRDRIEAAIYRLAAGRFRILYDVYADELVILKVALRNEATYRR